MSNKAYTVAEANFLIPTLEGIFTAIEERMAQVHRTAERLQVLDVLWGAKITTRGNPDYAEAQGYRAQIANLMGEIEEIVEREIDGRSLRFPPGGLEHGLIDFPTTWQGRWVYLCWHRGEPVVEAWHELDGGFAGRQELTVQQIREMGRMGSPEGGPPFRA